MRCSLHFASLCVASAAFLSLVPACPDARAQSAADAAPAASSIESPDLAQKIRVPGIHNAGRINEALYRGAQPSKQGLAQLKQLGVTTIVNLRGWQHEVASERKHAEALGLRFINIPVNGWAPPSEEQVVQFLSLFRNARAEKIFVHCKFGDDRTGVMVAAYRIAENHWSAQQAIQEMLFFGFHNHWHPSMESFVRKFPANLEADPAFASLRNAPASKQ